MLIPPAQTELLLSAQDHADEPPSSLYESMIPITDPYVPPIIKKVPMTITKMAQKTPNFHLQLRSPLFQLS